MNQIKLASQYCRRHVVCRIKDLFFWVSPRKKRFSFHIPGCPEVSVSLWVTWATKSNISDSGSRGPQPCRKAWLHPLWSRHWGGALTCLYYFKQITVVSGGTKSWMQRQVSCKTTTCQLQKKKRMFTQIGLYPQSTSGESLCEGCYHLSGVSSKEQKWWDVKCNVTSH